LSGESGGGKKGDDDYSVEEELKGRDEKDVQSRKNILKTEKDGKKGPSSKKKRKDQTIKKKEGGEQKNKIASKTPEESSMNKNT